MTLRFARSKEMAARLAALDTSQAVIEFNLDGTIITANANFLATVGYDLEEIQGQHHRMFVDDEYARSDEYREFWEILRSGAFHSGQYRRVGKDGREIWIEATYNPVLDGEGRPVKIVKYASDITALRRELADRRGQVPAIRTALAVIAVAVDRPLLGAADNGLASGGYARGG
ncbi:MAG: PAS domain-containing protein, partial [Actinomycetes bacterium]